MSCLRPATPGFIVTLVATILLALVSFNTPIIKSLSFLQATIEVDNVNGTIRLGTLGYCLDLSSNGTTCSSPSVGYSFDLNDLIGNDTSIEIPTVVEKWITYALFLHVIAFCFAAGSAFFGLLAHVREMSMTCCSTCISGFAAVIALVAFIFDIVLFFVVKKRVESVDGTASFESAVWLTLAAWVLLFFAGCVYSCGRCCVGRRSRNYGGEDGRMENSWMNKFKSNNDPSSQYAEQMRLDAVKAEADRKARQKEVGLPAFPNQTDAYRPLRGDESDEDASTPYRDAAAAAGVGAAAKPGARRQGSASTATTAGPGQGGYRGGYAQAAPGTRAVDDYYNAPSSPAPSNAHSQYPPQRQYSGSTNMSSPPIPGGFQGAGAAAAMGAGAGYMANQAAGGHSQYASSAATYGHTNGGSSYHTAASSQQQDYPSTGYSDPYSVAAVGMPAAGAYAGGAQSPPPQQQPSRADPYYSHGQGSFDTNAYGGGYASGNNAYGQQGYANSQDPNYGYGAAGYGEQQNQPERSYTLGGAGYGSSANQPSVPSPTTHGASGVGAAYSSPYGTPALSQSPPPMPTANVAASAYPTGARSPTQPTYTQPTRQESYEDGPPGYEAGVGGSSEPSVHVPAWGAKR